MDFPSPRAAARTAAALALLAAGAAGAGAQAPDADAVAGVAEASRLVVVERQALVMGTRLAVRVQAPAPAAAPAAEAALEAARRVEALLSTWRDDTELAALNAAPAAERHGVSPELASVLAELDGWVAETGGAFDPAIGALVDAWDLRGEGRVPSEAERRAAVEASGWDLLELDVAAGTATRGSEGLWLDAGAFGKGLALRAAGAELRAAGATGTLNFGGQILAVGAWAEVGVASPEARARRVRALRVSDASVATTAGSERFVEVDGRRYGHVLDPRTGEALAPWGSVTVVAEDPMVADLLSTALFVMGPERAIEWAADRPWGVLVQEAGETAEGPRVAWNAALERWLSDEAAPAAAEAPAQDTTELARLKRQVDAITRELERMRLGGDVVEEADTSVLGFGPAASKVYKVAQGVSIGGYGEVLYEWFDDELEDGSDAPKADQWDALRAIVYFGYKFNDRLLFNSEIELEHANEAYLEFAYLDYRVSDAVGLRGGLLLSPMGLVNELHEPPVFLGTTRPMVERSIIPTTWRENGFGVFGDVGPVSYRAYVLNGLTGAENFSASGLRGGRQKGSKAVAEDVAGVVRVDYVGRPGLLVGGSVYYGGSGQGERVSIDQGGTLVDTEIQANTLIWEGHASWQSRGLDLRGLIAAASVDDAELINAFQGLSGSGSVGERLTGGYAHAGYDVLRRMDTSHALIPYVRYEWMNTQAEVPEGFTADPANDRTALLLGAAWKPVPQVAIKGDYQLHSTDAETGRNEFALVLSYLF